MLVRHGESEWNARGLLTGWGDPGLTTRGIRQAADAGRRLAGAGIRIDRAHASALRRAGDTARHLLGAAGCPSTPVQSHWQLNERHLGALEGLSKDELRRQWDRDERRRWRDDPLALPPPLDPGDRRLPRHDPRYRHVPPGELPNGESRRQAEVRVLGVLHAVLAGAAPAAAVLVVSHQGPLRAILEHLGHTPAGAPASVPNGEPFVIGLAEGWDCCPLAGGGREADRGTISVTA